MDQRFTVTMQALENLTQDKRKRREEKHVAAETCQKGPQLWLSSHR